jgi:hypothetical protein
MTILAKYPHNTLATCHFSIKKLNKKKLKKIKKKIKTFKKLKIKKIKKQIN